MPDLIDSWAAKSEDCFSVTHTLSKPKKGWAGKSGRVNADLLKASTPLCLSSSLSCPVGSSVTCLCHDGLALRTSSHSSGPRPALVSGVAAPCAGC